MTAIGNALRQLAAWCIAHVYMTITHDVIAYMYIASMYHLPNTWQTRVLHCCCCADFVRAADKAKLDLLILGGDAIASPFITDAFKDNPGLLKGVTITAFNQGSDDFQAKFKAAAPGVEYDGNAAQGYDAMTALLNAYSSTPSPREPRAIAKAIPKQNFIGVFALQLWQGT